MDDRLKRRLIGAAVLASLAVIFVPMLIEDEPVPGEGAPDAAVPPRENLTFRSQVLKDEITVPTDAPPPAAEPEGEQAATAARVPGPDLVPEPEPEPESAPPAEEPAPPPAVPAPPPAPPKPAVAAEPAPPPEKPKTPPAQVAKATPPAPKAPAAAAPKITTWIVQVGNYSSRDKAEGVARQLRGKGLEVFIEPIGSPAVFRVAVGPESERRRAEALIPRIQAALPGSGKPFIRSYP